MFVDGGTFFVLNGHPVFLKENRGSCLLGEWCCGDILYCSRNIGGYREGEAGFMGMFTIARGP